MVAALGEQEGLLAQGCRPGVEQLPARREHQGAEHRGHRLAGATAPAKDLRDGHHRARRPLGAGVHRVGGRQFPGGLFGEVQPARGEGDDRDGVQRRRAEHDSGPPSGGAQVGGQPLRRGRVPVGVFQPGRVVQDGEQQVGVAEGLGLDAQAGELGPVAGVGQLLGVQQRGLRRVVDPQVGGRVRGQQPDRLDPGLEGLTDQAGQPQLPGQHRLGARGQQRVGSALGAAQHLPRQPAALGDPSLAPAQVRDHQPSASGEVVQPGGGGFGDQACGTVLQPGRRAVEGGLERGHRPVQPVPHGSGVEGRSDGAGPAGHGRRGENRHRHGPLSAGAGAPRARRRRGVDARSRGRTASRRRDRDRVTGRGRPTPRRAPATRRGCAPAAARAPGPGRRW